MKQTGQKIEIVGGGIAGLCTAVYAQKCGYQAEVLEMNSIAGGLATSWQRGHYTFETCLHWLLGSKPGGEMHAQWQDVVDIDKLTFVNPEVFTRIETESGEALTIYTNVDRLEAELLRRAPQDKKEILRLTGYVRKLSRFKMPDPAASWTANAMTLLREPLCLRLLGKLSGITAKEYAEKFSDPLIWNFFAGGEMGQLSALALVFSLAFMHAENAGYAIGGSQALIRGIEEKLASLGGRVRLDAKVDRILVERDQAVGLKLASGETIDADWVVSAADGYATINELLNGKYSDEAIRKTYDTMATFPSYVQVSLGVAMDLKDRPGMETFILDSPFHVDCGTYLHQVGFRIFHFDPTFAPAGKTAVTCFLPTRNFEYWVDLQEQDRKRYCAEKHRLAESVIGILEKKVPDIRKAIEVIDVSTPATVIRYTGNWKGSMEGWMIAPGTGFKPLRNTLPGLGRFIMAGQWVLPGGGLPSGLITARTAMRTICKQDRVPFPPLKAFSNQLDSNKRLASSEL
jgi:phytoene dehydrogenase-like protein